MVGISSEGPSHGKKAEESLSYENPEPPEAHKRQRVSRLLIVGHIIVLSIILFVLLVAALLIDAACKNSCLNVSLTPIVWWLGVIGIIVYALYEEVKTRNIIFGLADKGIYVERGIFSKKAFLIPYVAIQDIDIERNLIERVLGIGTVIINTAGVTHIKEGDSIHIPGVVNPYKFARDALSQIRATHKEGAVSKMLAHPEIQQIKESHERFMNELKDVKESLEGFGDNIDVLEERIKKLEDNYLSMRDKLLYLIELVETQNTKIKEMSEAKVEERAAKRKQTSKAKSSTKAKSASKSKTKKADKKGGTRSNKTKKTKQKGKKR